MKYPGCLKELNYVNDIGEPKKIVVYPPKDGEYPVHLWSLKTGDFCGSGKFTLEKLNDFMDHYKIAYKFKE